MDKIKIYSAKTDYGETHTIFDAGAVEYRIIEYPLQIVMKGDTILMESTCQKAQCLNGTPMSILEPSYFEIVSDGVLTERDQQLLRHGGGVWCRDPRILMGWALHYWVGAYIEPPFDEVSNLVNPLPSMEEALRFLKSNGMWWEVNYLSPRRASDLPKLREPWDYVNVPPKFQALVEKYKSR